VNKQDQAVAEILAVLLRLPPLDRLDAFAVAIRAALDSEVLHDHDPIECGCELTADDAPPHIDTNQDVDLAARSAAPDLTHSELPELAPRSGPLDGPWMNRGDDPVSTRVYALIFNGLTLSLRSFMPLSERERMTTTIYESLRTGDIEVRLVDGLEKLRETAAPPAGHTHRCMRRNSD
jgi:hypothetical protein